MNKELKLILRIKDELAAGLSAASSKLSSWSEGIGNGVKYIAAGLAAAGTAAITFGAKALSAYAESEAATSSMASALRAYGEDVKSGTALVKQYADAIAKETGAQDDALIARAARLKMLGVETAAMGDALRATEALAAYGMDEEQAIRAVINAREGNFSALQKYIPALQAATTEEEKSAMLQDYLTRGYAIQQEKLGTLSGRWNSLKSAIGDAWEEMGAAIAKNDTIAEGLEFVTGKVVAFSNAVKEWVGSGGVEEARFVFQTTLESIRYGFESAWFQAKTFFSLISDAKPVQYFVNLFAGGVNMIVGQAKYLVGWIGAIWEKIQNPMSEFKAPNLGLITDTWKQQFDNLRGLYVKDKNDYQQALIDKERAAQEHAARQANLDQQYSRNLFDLARSRAASEQTAAQAAVTANTNAAIKINAITKRVGDEAVRVADKREDSERNLMREIQAANESAAANVSQLWTDTTTATAQRQLDLYASMAQEAESMGGGSVSARTTSRELGWTGVTGSVSGSSSANRNLAGVRDWRIYSPVNTQTWMNGAGGVDRIVGALNGIRQDNQQLMRFG